MILSAKEGVAEFVVNCAANGLKHVVCSPGSRNAPLVISFDEHPEISTYVIHDERSAGFFALGLSLALNEPVVVCCTSGSAVVNYFPAVTEAFYQGIPLVVISADRPAELINQGDGQTIMQENVFGKHVLARFSLDESDVFGAKQLVCEMLEQLGGNWRGPIHVNVPVTEPLYLTKEYEVNIVAARHIKAESGLSLDDELLTEWNAASKILVLCGQMIPNRPLREELAILAQDPRVVILVENTSNLIHPSFNHCIDRSLAAIDWDSDLYKPDLLISIGEAIVSKKIKSFLRTHAPKKYWRVSFSFPEMDTYFCKTSQLSVSPLPFIKKLNQHRPLVDSRYGSLWKKADLLAQDKVQAFITHCDFSDLSVCEAVLDAVPDGSNVHLANSASVRYAQLFNPVNSLSYYSNRGTSGIDGSVSTACGVAWVNQDKFNVLITGDTSFFYDSNALWSNYLSKRLRIIVVNNNGGGIFKIIDGPTSTRQLKKYFEAPHSRSAEYICKAFDVHYSAVRSQEELEINLLEFFRDEDGPKLLEAFTPTEENDKVLKRFFEHIKNN